MSQYFRITGYNAKQDTSFIVDSNGMFEKLWQFSAYLVSKGCKVLEVSTAEKFRDINITKADPDSDHIFLRATCKGKPNYLTTNITGVDRKIIDVDKKQYIPE